METKKFGIEVLLSVTTGRLLTKRKGERDNGISDLYELLGWMTSDSPFTHQLGRFSDECKPWLLRWWPNLARFEDTKVDTSMDEIFSGDKSTLEQRFQEWLKLRATEFGCEMTYSVPKIPRDDHTIRNPYDELVEMRGTDEGIVIASRD